MTSDPEARRRLDSHDVSIGALMGEIGDVKASVGRIEGQLEILVADRSTPRSSRPNGKGEAVKMGGMALALVALSQAVVELVKHVLPH